MARSRAGSHRVVRMVVLPVFLVLGVQFNGAAAPQAELWPRWEAHVPGATTTVDHRDWGVFLQRYVVTDTADGVNRVDYSAVSREDRQMLQRYIASLEAVAVSRLDRREQLAFWTNLYNAVTVELILENYPLQSIRRIRRPWDTALVTVEQEPLTLNDIEHRIMRPIWNDPRIHYVVNCASIGCPNLLPVPFTGATWDSLADEAARGYINHPRGIDLSGQRPVFSSIYSWYAVDFGGDIAGVVDHALPYAEAPLAVQLRRFRQEGFPGRVAYEYDWDLNSR